MTQIKGRKLFWLKAITALAVLALCLGTALTGATVFANDSRDIKLGGASGKPPQTEMQLYGWANISGIWVFSSLNPGNSSYNEGDSIPFYLHITNPGGNPITATITYDYAYKETGHPGSPIICYGYDYLTTFNTTYNPSVPGVSGIPTDTTAIPGGTGYFWLYNASFTGSEATGPTQYEMGRNVYRYIDTYLQPSGQTTPIYLLWAGHLATPSGSIKGAGDWPGGSMFMTVELSSVKYLRTIGVNLQETPPTNEPPLLEKEISGTTGTNGWYISPVRVTLRATDTDSGIAYTEYSYSTDDGPTTSVRVYPAGTPYQQIVVFVLGAGASDQGVNELYHVAWDLGNPALSSDLNPGSAQSPQYIKIDTVPPTLTKSLDGTLGKNGWYVSPVTVTLTAEDATSGVYQIKYTVNGDETVVNGYPERTTTAQTDFRLENDGGYDLTHQTSDYAGHTTVLQAQKVKVDQTPPSLTKNAARTGATEVTVTLTGTDATSGVDYIRYSVDGGMTWAQAPVVNGYGPNTFQTAFVINGIGEHALSHLVFDVAGNQFVLGDQIITIEGTTPGGTMLYMPRLVITLDILGTAAEYPVTPEGRLINAVRVTSPDGTVTLEIPAGTLVLNADGTPTYLNEDYDIVFINAAPPAAPPGYQLIAAYQAFPGGLTFSKDARLIITYDENKLPAGSTAVIAYYDEAKKVWTPLETAGYVASGGIEIPNTVVSRVGHFTYFAVLAKLPAK